MRELERKAIGMLLGRPAIVGALALLATYGTTVAQGNLFVMNTTIPVEADNWYQDHYRDTVWTKAEWVFATVYADPDTGAPALGGLSVVARRNPYLHFSWVFRSGSSKTDAPWREDVGDWGYGINQFVVDTLAGWVRLPPGPYGAIGWVRLTPDRVVHGFAGYVQSIAGLLVTVSDIEATHARTGELAVVSGVMFIDSVEEGIVSFRPELPSDMECGEEHGPDPEVPTYRSRVTAFLTDDVRPRFEIAYPKGC